jgi:hypothetical protein
MVPLQSPCKTENNDAPSVVAEGETTWTGGEKNALSTTEALRPCVKGQGEGRQRAGGRTHTHNGEGAVPP